MHELETGAELVRETARLRLLAERGEEVIAAGKCVVDRGKARRHHHGAGDPVARAHAAEVEGLLYVLGVAMPVRDAGRLLRRIREDMPDLGRLEPQERGRRRRRAEGGTKAVG